MRMARRRDALSALLTPEAVRERANELYELALADATPHFRLTPDRLNEAAELVAGMTRAAYPDLTVPLHSRWRHFELDDGDLWAEVQDAHPRLRGDALARSRSELAIVSVLLDAGAGDRWRFDDPETARRFSRSEGLAVASLRMYQNGGFSQNAREAPLRVDARALSSLSTDTLQRHFQVRDDNPLAGIKGRVALMQALGRAIMERPGIFGDGENCRLGGLYDELARRADAAGGRLAARDVLLAVLELLNGIWPSGLVVEGVPLGDVGRHRLVRRGDASDGLVPFHKLAQWLTYSLIEPLRQAGLTIAALDELTGLPEYRNGGLFIDCGVLVPRVPSVSERPLDPASEPIVEWRALTVALLDRLAVQVREKLGMDSNSLPLGAVLQGGSWAAGRRLAQELRGGAPPIEIVSDGTVF